MIHCADGSLYTGITTDVARRLAQHRNGEGSRYLRGRGPLELVAHWVAGGRASASRTEHRIKRLSREQKLELVRRPERLRALLGRDHGSANSCTG